mmetsp:Transcript_24442/g.37132  ORF Transcript_24442/g.37132 Transcript_24442/m.37132 type:complete len:341 (+) Transcript_24442:44-1066(+)
MRMVRSSVVWIIPFCGIVIGAPIQGDDEQGGVRRLRESVANRGGPRGGSAGGRTRDYSDFERRYLPTSSPTADTLQCNICSVSGATISRYSKTVTFNNNLVTCHGLEQLSLNGNIPEDKCEEAQSLALSSCGCIIDEGFTSGDIPSTCPVPSTPLTTDQQDWLDLHNSRREFWHAFYDADFEELCWDEDLASQAQYYADYLASNCLAEHDQSKPDPNGFRRCRNAGENLAFDNRNGVGRSAKDIVYAWTDNEYTLTFPFDGHMTQVLWRPSRYLGCARASNSACRWSNIQVCRYVRPGNCNCGGPTCREKMLEDSSLCGTAEVTVTADQYETCFDNYHGI